MKFVEYVEHPQVQHESHSGIWVKVLKSSIVWKLMYYSIPKYRSKCFFIYFIHLCMVNL